MARNDNPDNQVSVKKKGESDEKAIRVFPIDAKELIASGNYEMVEGVVGGGVDWLPPEERQEYVKKGEKAINKPLKKAKAKAKKEAEADEEETLEEDEDLEDETEEKDIGQMVTAELDALVEEEEFDIDGYSGMKLAEKRKAVKGAWESKYGSDDNAENEEEL